MDKYKWGIDLGGTKIEAAILDTSQDNKIIERQRVPTLADQGYETVLNQVSTLMTTMENKSGLKPQALGIGTPGRLDRESGTIKNSNSVCLNGKPFLKDLEARLNIPIKIENDANCFALSEATHIRSSSTSVAQVIIGIIIGTGVGGGIIIDGKVLSGLHGIGGEWGHNFLDASGGECYCGKIGCVEKVIAGPALEHYYKKLSGTKLSLKEINDRALENELHAVATLDRLHKYFGKGISVLLNIIDPDVVVIGGGVGNIDSLYTKGVECIGEHHFNNKLKTKFMKPKFGDSSGVIGAALL